MRIIFYISLFLLIEAVYVASQELIAIQRDSDADIEEETSQGIKESTKDIFVPTAEWKEIMAGQAIPRGLHVRINMETGKKEAKILDPEVTETKETLLNHQELKEALKNIKNDMKSGETVSSKFRTMAELKEDFKELNLKVETDFEVMTRLVQIFEDAETDTDRVEPVQTLEYYVHQYDNALDFLTLGGVERVLIPSLNSSSVDLQEMAGFLIGSAAQSNPRVQRAFLESGFVPTLLRLISAPASPGVCGKALYGLSAMLRNFPTAQDSLVRHGGLDVFKLVFKFQGKPFDKIKIKILTLVQDLLDERRNLDLGSEVNKDQVDQYSGLNLSSLLVNSGWCDVFQSVLVLPRDDRRAKRDDILSTVSDEFPLRAEHDSIEKIVLAMVGLREECAPEYRKNKELNAKLSELSRQYEDLSAREKIQDENDRFFSNLLQTINLVLKADNVKIEL